MRRTTPLQVLVLSLVTAAAVTLSAAAAVARPWLGVYTQEVTSDLRDGLDLRDGDDGVLVNRVVEDSPADRAGLRKGDLILRFNSRSVDSPQALARLVGESRNGQEIALEILRHGDRQTLSVTLAGRPTDGDEDDMTLPRAPRAPAAPAPPAAPNMGDEDEHGDQPGDNDRDDDNDNNDNERHTIRMHGVTPEGKPFTYRYEGDTDQLRTDVHRMLGNMDLQGMGNRARLGVRIESLSDDLASALGVPGGEGVLVVQVMDDTPAQRAGLKAGDVILAVEGHDVKDAAGLQRELRDAEGHVSLDVSRRGSRRTLEADLGAARTGRGDGELPRVRRLRLRDDDSGGSDAEMRQQLEELRQQVRDLRRQLEEERNRR